ALGIGLFIFVLAILLIFACWYYKRRSGYKSLRVSRATHFPERYYFDNLKNPPVGTIRTMVGEGTVLDSKMALPEYGNINSVVPDAPPAYDKIAADPSPPPYSP
ncbi:MAR1 protein, partial [Rhinopomastus cyanomelas]|nr:MAR1 protein [Rhinopomastus cyanomelas]